MIEGRVWKYKDNINTDIISPPAYMELKMEEAAKYAMSPVDPTFAKECRTGDILVAENNIGSGSSRETAPLTLKICGINTIVAKSYARIFYRNCINVGILAIICKDTEKISKNDIINIDHNDGKIYNKTTDEVYECNVIPKHIMEIVECGGLLEYLKQKAKKNVN